MSHETTVMEETVVFFSEGVPTVGILCFPTNFNRTKKYPIIVLCHGYSGYKDEGYDVVASKLAQLGYLSFRFDFRGCGLSGQSRGHMICDSQWVADLRNAISLVLTYPFVEPCMLGVLGGSMGGTTAFMAAEMDQRIRYVIALGSPVDGRVWLESLWCNRNGVDSWQGFLRELEMDRIQRIRYGKSNCIPINKALAMTPDDSKLFVESRSANPLLTAKATLESVESIFNMKPFLNAEKIKIPALLFHGKWDMLVPIDQSRSMFEALQGSKQLITLETNIHHLPGSFPDEIVATITNWLLDFQTAEYLEKSSRGTPLL